MPALNLLTNSLPANNITGENLMDIDQNVLKEMGIKKVGDRVRIGAQAKQFRFKEYRKKRNSTNRVSDCHVFGFTDLLTCKGFRCHRRSQSPNSAFELISQTAVLRTISANSTRTKAPFCSASWR